MRFHNDNFMTLNAQFISRFYENFQFQSSVLSLIQLDKYAQP